MTDDTVTSVDNTDDLDAFSSDFFSNNPIKTVSNEAEPEIEEEVVNPGEDDNPPASEPEDVGEPEDEAPEEEAEEPKAKKQNKVQERINELTADKRVAEREAEAARKVAEDLRREFEAFKASVEKDAPSKELRDRLPDGAPDPDAKLEDGEPKYPLGEFDPGYITDLTKFVAKQERETARKEYEEAQQAREFEKAQQEINDKWNERVSEAEKEIPTVRESIQTLSTTFQNIEPNYGAYLANTIMLSDFGPQIMDYLSQNIGEAQSIVASGPAAATLALGRLEARFVKSSEEKKSDKIVSKAPVPPQAPTRGSGGKFSVAPDTDDLEAFEGAFFGKSK